MINNRRFNRNVPPSNPSVSGYIIGKPITMSGLFPGVGWFERLKFSSYGVIEVAFILIDDTGRRWLFMSEATLEWPRAAHQIANYISDIRIAKHAQDGQRITVRYFPQQIEASNGNVAYRVESVRLD